MTDKKRYYRQKTGPASFSSIALPRPNQLILYFCRVMLRQVPFRQHSFFYLVRVYFKVCAFLMSHLNLHLAISMSVLNHRPCLRADQLRVYQNPKLVCLQSIPILISQTAETKADSKLPNTPA